MSEYCKNCQKLQETLEITQTQYEKVVEQNKNLQKELRQRKQKFEVCLTFIEIERINKLVQEKIKNKDYGFAPCVSILFDTPNKEFEEYQEIKICCLHDITKEINKAEEEKRKINILPLYTDVTDEDKADFI